MKKLLFKLLRLVNGIFNGSLIWLKVLVGLYRDTITFGAMKDFKQFDVVPSISDHHFLRSRFEIKENSSVLKKITREWKILEDSLPESIFVRASEEKINLLRAAIIGSPGTPYYSGIFFFDFCFPTNYPAQPPSVFYHSFGLSLNPNLYNNGKVCLSLLNTWYGNKNEKWNSSTSTVFQVLLSLQALVLNEKPIFNEPMTVVHLESKSRIYNEYTWLNTCRTMRFLLKQPPMHFGEFVRSHFREQAEAILSACKAYVDGRVKIGGLIQTSTSSSHIHKVSERFKVSMMELYPRLFDSIASTGVSLDEFRAELVFPPKRALERKDGAAKKVFNKLKKIFMWKKKEETKAQ